MAAILQLQIKAASWPQAAPTQLVLQFIVYELVRNLEHVFRQIAG